jgi:hypothetical protein
MNMRIGLPLIGILATSLAACGGGKSTTLTTDDLCTMMASVECSGSPTNCAFTSTACTTARKAVCLSFVAMVNVGGRVFVPGNVEACISATMTAYAKSLITPSDLATMADKCNYVFQGTSADLAACTTKYDCKNSGDICDKGRCATQMVKGANAQCSDFGAVCGSTQYCKMAGGATMCVNKIASGQACDDTDPCDDTKQLTCANGTCVPQSAMGDTCIADADCLAAAPYCNPYAGGKCSTGLTFAAGATACNDYGGTGPTTGIGGSNGGGGAGGSGGSGGAGGAGGSGGASGASGSGGAGGSSSSDGGGADADAGATG